MSIQTTSSVVSENIDVAKIQIGAESVLRPTSGGKQSGTLFLGNLGEIVGMKLQRFATG